MEHAGNRTRERDDFILPFQLESSRLRGRLVRLGPLLDTVLKQHAYPVPVGRLLGEAVALTLVLGSSLKFDGVFTLQIKSDAAVSLLVADVTTDGAVRAYARFDPERFKDDNPGMIGDGHLAFTVDQADVKDRYQGIVKLEGDNLSEAVKHYFRQSEQIPTGIMSAACHDEEGRWRGGALMLQRMPREGGATSATDTATEDDWSRAMTLMQTCTPEELTDVRIDSETLLFRLFHEEGVRIYKSTPCRHECRCSQDRVAAMLEALPVEDVRSLAVDGCIEVTCEFCNRRYDITESAFGNPF